LAYSYRAGAILILSQQKPTENSMAAEFLPHSNDALMVEKD
jgi:hypothetical protein